MGQMKDLFISMQEGLLMGSRMDLQVRGRIADEEYQLSTKDSDEDAMAYIDEGHSEGTQYYTEKQALKTIKEILAEDEYLLDGRDISKFSESSLFAIGYNFYSIYKND